MVLQVQFSAHVFTVFMGFIIYTPNHAATCVIRMFPAKKQNCPTEEEYLLKSVSVRNLGIKWFSGNVSIYELTALFDPLLAVFRSGLRSSREVMAITNLSLSLARQHILCSVLLPYKDHHLSPPCLAPLTSPYIFWSEPHFEMKVTRHFLRRNFIALSWPL